MAGPNTALAALATHATGTTGGTTGTTAALGSVALVGNRNCGKTALFNLLTGARQKVANYAGVTVERKIGQARLPDGRSVAVIDLPGTYSLQAATLGAWVLLPTAWRASLQRRLGQAAPPAAGGCGGCSGCGSRRAAKRPATSVVQVHCRPPAMTGATPRPDESAGAAAP